MQGLLLFFIDCRGASVYILVLMIIERKWAQQVIILMNLTIAYFFFVCLGVTPTNA